MLERLLRPATIATFGGRPAEQVVEQLDLLGWDGEVWPVHPTRAALGERPCLHSVDDLPAAPDAAFVAVPREVVTPIVRALAAAGCGGAVVYTSGFAESGADELQRALVEAAGDMPLLGPNTYGYVNALDGTSIWPDVHGLRPVDAGVAIVTQSGNIGINLTMARRSLDIGLVVTAGNQAGLTVPAIVEELVTDPRVTAIGVQFEGAADGVAFGRAAIAAAECGVPVVALKMGSSPRGAAVSTSHTGALVGENDVWDALFRRYGVARARTIPAFLEALKLAPLVPGSPRVVSLSSSGGEAALVADLAAQAGVDLPELEAGHAEAVAATVGELVAVGNPMDYHTFSWGDFAKLRATFNTLIADSFDVAMLVLDFPRGEVPPPWWTAVGAFAEAAAGVAGLVVATLPEAMPAAAQERVRAMGLIPMLGLAETIEALGALPGPGAEPLHWPARPVEGGEVVDEARSKELLAAAGIAVPAGEVTADPHAASVTYPVTVKVLGIAHKAAAGAVAVGLADEEAVQRAVAAMPAAERYLVEETVAGGGVELLVSVRSVPGLGWLLTLGAGGTLVELADDRTHRLLPRAAPGIEAAVGELRVAARLADPQPVVDVALALQALVAGDERILEVEVNPLVVGADGAVAVDAMVTRQSR